MITSIVIARFRTPVVNTLKGCARVVLLVSAVFVGALVPEAAQANPQNGTVVSGNTTIINTPSELQIRQSSDRTLIDWASFNIGKGEVTHFYQPGANSIAVNRVVNSTQLSALDGSLIANGRIVVINPNGVLIGPNGRINTAGFVATTADMSNDALSKKELVFNRPGNPDAIVENQGHITVAETGLAALVAPTVRNSGVIEGNKVQLAAADTFAVDFSGDGLLSFAVASSEGSGHRTLTAENSGSIIADGGKVLMTAATASDVVSSVINDSGYIQARGLKNVNGEVVLTGQGADVQVSGKIDASGTTGGGAVKIGGDSRGQGTLATAMNVTITKDAVIKADATENGNGGSVIAWSENATVAQGQLSARGGAQGGNGGTVETSSQNVIYVEGAIVDALAPSGATGSWLLDPDTINISATGVAWNSSLPATGTSTIGVATINASSSNVVLWANKTLNIGADINMTHPTASLFLVAGVSGSNITGTINGISTSLRAGTGTITLNNNYVRTVGGSVTFLAGNNIAINHGTFYLKGLGSSLGGNLNLIAGSVSINNTSIYVRGGNVTIKGIAAGCACDRTSGDVSTNSVIIDTTSPLVSSVGGIRLIENGSTLAFNNFGNSNTFVHNANGGSITIDGKTISGNSDCFAAGGVGCGVLDPLPVTYLRVAADSGTKIYGSLDPSLLTYTYTGTLLSGDSFIGALTRTTGENVGTYNILQGTLTASGAGNYAITYVGNTFTISPAKLTITADDKIMTYGGAMPTLTVSYSGFVNGDNSFSLTTKPTVTSATQATADAGTYYNTITAKGAVDSNYTISYVKGDLTINKAALKITADDKSMTYGGSMPTLTVSYSGFVNGDNSFSLTKKPTVTSATPATANAGTYANTLTASGAVDSNYTISYVAGDLTINKAALKITANDKTMTYGGSMPTLTVSYSGFVNGDNSSSLTTKPTVTSATPATADAGTYYNTITAKGAVDNNYTICYVKGDLTINKAALIIKADDKSMTYGGTMPTLTVSYSGFVNGDNSSSLTKKPTVTSATLATAGAGTYTDTITAKGAVDKNYTISYVAGDLTIGKASLLITADSKSMTYGGVMPALTASYSGFVNGDDASKLTAAPTVVSGTAATANAGTYTGTLTASGAVDGNYTISYAAGDLTIDPARLLITADSKGMTYGGIMPTLTASYTGFVNGDDASKLTTAPTVVSGTAANANAGTYEGTLTASGAVDANYTISYAAGDLIIGKAELLIAADNQHVTYGGVMPSLTASYSGFVNGDDASKLTTAPTVVSGTPATASVGTYKGTLTASGAVEANYTISYAAGDLTINPAPVSTFPAGSFIRIDPLGRPILSYNNNVIVQNLPFKPYEIHTLDTNVSIKAPPQGRGGDIASIFNAISPAAGGSHTETAGLTPEELNAMAPAAGGNGRGGATDESIACGNSFLDNKSCGLAQ